MSSQAWRNTYLVLSSWLAVSTFLWALILAPFFGRPLAHLPADALPVFLAYVE